MDQLDAIYQTAVDHEVDRLARLSPFELMQLKPGSWRVDTEQGSIELACLVHDDSNVRQIAVISQRPVVLGFAKRKFAGALKVNLSCERLSNCEVMDLYD